MTFWVCRRCFRFVALGFLTGTFFWQIFQMASCTLLGSPLVRLKTKMHLQRRATWLWNQNLPSLHVVIILYVALS